MSATVSDEEAPSECGRTDETTWLRRMQPELLQIVTTSSTQSVLLERLAKVISSHSRPIAGYYFHCNSRSEPTVKLRLFTNEGDAQNAKFTRQLSSSCTAACRSGELDVRIQTSPPRVIVAAPIPTGGEAANSLGIIFQQSDSTPQLIMFMQLIVGHIILWQVMANQRETETDARDAAVLIELLEHIVGAADLRHACYALAGDIQSHLSCLRVVVGLRHHGRGHCRLAAISGLAQFDARSDATHALEAAMDEAVMRDELITWPPVGDCVGHALLAHKHLCSRDAVQSVVSVPLRDPVRGAIGVILALSDSTESTGNAQQFLRVAQSSLATALGAAQRFEGGFLAKKLRSASRFRQTMSVKLFTLAATTALASMTLPWPHKIHCHCQIEPVTRRFVAAPFEGTLEKTFVKPGDIVGAGDCLARMDGREIRWKRASVAADQSQAKKKRDAAQATHNYADQQIAELEMQRVEMELKLLDNRAENLEIRSPIAGVISSGDLQRAEGAPLKTGQTLFEVGPLERVIVEIAVTDAEISYVSTGQELDVRIDAFPSARWKTTVTSVQPRSEIRDEDNVFIAEAEIENANGRLRPGMKGRAGINTGNRWLGWILFHKPLEYASKSLIW